MPFCLHFIRVLPRLSDCISHLYFLTVCFLLMQSLRCWSSGEQEPQSFRKEAATAALDIHAVGVIPTIKNRDKEWTNAQWINRKDQYCWDNHPLDFQSFTLPRPNCTELKKCCPDNFPRNRSRTFISFATGRCKMSRLGYRADRTCYFKRRIC